MTLPETHTESTFASISDAAMERFLANSFCRAVTDGTISIDAYARLLRQLYFQVRSSPTTFALAACHCKDDQLPLRDYFLKHAHEEKTHHSWILDDLRECGVTELDEIASTVPAAAECYVAYNYYIATVFPLGRLAIAYVLETLGGRFAASLATRGISILQLRREQATFFLSHATTDAVHMNEVAQTLREFARGSDWEALSRVASNAARLYANLYNAAVE